MTQLCQSAIEISDAIGDTFLKSLALTVWCNDSISRTDFIQADQLSRRLIDLSQELGDPRPEGMGRLLLAFTRGYEEQYVEALSHAEELIRLAVNPLDELMGRCAKGAILAFSGRQIWRWSCLKVPAEISWRTGSTTCFRQSRLDTALRFFAAGGWRRAFVGSTMQSAAIRSPTTVSCALSATWF